MPRRGLIFLLFPLNVVAFSLFILPGYLPYMGIPTASASSTRIPLSASSTLRSDHRLTMAPTIHLVRHAQGYHNLSVENESIHDPDLTELGLEQCAALRSAFPHHASVTRLAASPLRRTLYTCIHGFGTDKLYPIAALDVLQEVSAAPCDTGSDVEKLAAEFENKGQWDGVREGWTDKGPSSMFEPNLHKLTARAREARRALREMAGQGDDHVVAVTHGGFLHFLTDDFQYIPEGHGEILTP